MLIQEHVNLRRRARLEAPAKAKSYARAFDVRLGLPLLCLPYLSLSRSSLGHLLVSAGVMLALTARLTHSTPPAVLMRCLGLPCVARFLSKHACCCTRTLVLCASIAATTASMPPLSAILILSWLSALLNARLISPKHVRPRGSFSCVPQAPLLLEQPRCQVARSRGQRCADLELAT